MTEPSPTPTFVYVPGEQMLRSRTRTQMHSTNQGTPGEKRKHERRPSIPTLKLPEKKKKSAFSHLCELRKIFEPPARVEVIELQSIGSVPPRVYL